MGRKDPKGEMSPVPQAVPRDLHLEELPTQDLPAEQGKAKSDCVHQTKEGPGVRKVLGKPPNDAFGGHGGTTVKQENYFR